MCVAMHPVDRRQFLAAALSACGLSATGFAHRVTLAAQGSATGPRRTFPPGGTSADIARTLAGLGFFSAADLRAVERGNAVQLLPRLA